MTLTVQAQSVDRRDALPLVWAFALVPLWWIAGVRAVAWFVIAGAMLLRLGPLGAARAPRRFGLWLWFLLFVAASAMALSSPDRWLAFGWRTALYLSATVFLLYVFNAPDRTLPASDVVRAVTYLWMAAVVGGWLALVLPRFEVLAPITAVLPGRLLEVGFVRDLVTVKFGDVTTFLGRAATRPVAPFTYSNEWGSNLALLTPFAIASLRDADGLRRTVIRALLALSIVPAVVSVNRGLWLSVGLLGAYAAIRYRREGNRRQTFLIVTACAFTVLVVYATPLQGWVVDRLAHPHSDRGRIELYRAATEGVADSPLIGHGAPEHQDVGGPAVGTHGQLWTVAFSHGIPAVALFVAWFVAVAFATRNATGSMFWLHCVLVLFVFQMPFYGLLPTQLHLAMVSAGVLLRELRPVTPHFDDREVP